MNIQHNPIFDIEKATKLYSEKDGVEVRYVCTSAPNTYAAYAADIFYRETPHPEFGNRYFGLYRSAADQIMITNTDTIESLEFDMVEVSDMLHYSQHRHDYRCVGSVCIDGGRAYLRLLGDVRVPQVKLKVKDGVFVNAKD